MFFIPCIKWNKHYYVRTSCCNTLYELDPEMGKAIARGEQVLIRPEHLQRISKVTYGYNYKHCNYCGYCLLYTSPSPRDYAASRMPSSA